MIRRQTLVISSSKMKNGLWNWPRQPDLSNYRKLPNNSAFTKRHCVFFWARFSYARKIVFRHKINFCVDVERMVCFNHVFGCALSVYHLRSHISILGSCVFTLGSRCYRTHNELKLFQISTSWTRKFPEHKLAQFCWDMNKHVHYLRSPQGNCPTHICFGKSTILTLYITVAIHRSAALAPAQYEYDFPPTKMFYDYQKHTENNLTSYLRMAISMLKIRRPLGRLIFNMGIAIPGKTVFLIETAPWTLVQYKDATLPSYEIPLWK